MIESGLNVRSDSRNSINMQLVANRHHRDDDHDDEDEDVEDKPIIRDIDLHSVRHLFVLIFMCYCLTFILMIMEHIMYKITPKRLNDYRRLSRRSTNHFLIFINHDRIVNSW